MTQSKIVNETANSPVELILDAIMYLSGSDNMLIRTTAFSTLSSLSKFSSNCKSVKAQIIRDINMPSYMTSQNYLDFITKRLMDQKEIFYKKVKLANVEVKYSGLYSLLRLA